MEHHHRSKLKQQNKGFKDVNKSSKRALSRSNKGKVEGKAVHNVKSTSDAGSSSSSQAGRAARVHKAKQSRDEQRKLLVAARRGTGGVAPAPRVAVLIGCTRSANLSSVKRMLLGKGADEMDEALPMGPITAQIGQSQQRVTVIEGSRDLVALLDTLMVADIVAFVANGDEDIDAKSMHLLHTSKLYGLPAATMVVLQGVDGLPTTKRAQVLKTWETGMAAATGREVKVLGQKPDDANVAIRFLANTKIPVRPSWQSHPLVLAERVQRAPDAAQAECGEGEVLIGVSGYIRGSALNPNSLMHIPAQGSYQLSKITVHSDPCPIGKSNSSASAKDEDVLPDAPEELKMDNEVDDMDAEQTWPTEEELLGAKERIRAPKGVGEYGASWFTDRTIDDEEGAEDPDEEDEEGMENEDGDDDNESEISEPPEEVIIGDDSDDDAMTEAGGGETMVGGEDFLDRRSRAKEDKEFPDEVDTPVDQPARVRFQKFRGLKSMRTSPWDPYENLPVDYQRISQFKNVMASRMRARAEGKNGVQPGKFVTVWLRVPMAFADKALEEAASADVYQPLVIGGLLKYENKMGMMHYSVTRVRDDGDVIKSKDTLILVCGMRRMEFQPIFSECKGYSDKHKVLRFLPPKVATFASAYAPVAWAPAPVLIMKKQKSGVLTVVAAGRVASPEANRITLKRIVLTALPYKIKKRKATCRFMFFNPADINWFKPVELWTKEGRRGHIKESLGTHGHMKCIFDSPILHSDTVCMSLYKRVFPPYPEDTARQLRTLGEVKLQDDKPAV